MIMSSSFLRRSHSRFGHRLKRTIPSSSYPLCPLLNHHKCSFTTSDTAQHSPLYSSYARIKAAVQSDNTSTFKLSLSSSSPSPLLSHLDLIDSENHLNCIDWSDWNNLR